MINEKIVDRIKKLLALSESDNEHEAQSAMVKAQELMAKHNLEMKDINVTKSDVIRNESENAANATWKHWLGNLIADNFRCKLYVQNYRRTQRLVFLGLKEDAEIALLIYEYALKVITKGANRVYREFKKLGYETRGIRNSYVRGFIDGLEEKFEDQKQAEKEYALVLYTPKEVREIFENMTLGEARESNFKCSYDPEAVRSGYVDGKYFTYGERIAVS